MGGSPGLPTAGQPGPMRPGEFTSASVPNVVTFAFKKIGPPSPLYIQRDDVLAVQIISLDGGESVTINARLLLPTEPAQIIAIQQVFAATQNAVKVFSIPLAEGYLLSVTAQSAQSDFRGVTYVKAFINRGPLSTLTANSYRVLFSDCPTSSSPVGWPDGRSISAGEGPGKYVAVAATLPAAGADWSVAVPALSQWQPICFNAVLVTGVAAPVRSVQVVITTGVNRYFTGPPSATIAASLTTQVSGSSLALASTVIATDVSVPIPPNLIMQAGHVFSVVTVGLAAADQWSAIFVMFQQWNALT